MAKTPKYRTQIINDLRRLPVAGWQALLERSPSSGAVFLKPEFLVSLQESGCVGVDSGWDPHFVCLTDEAGQLAAAAPLWIKTHSYGEYVFDWAWADAYHRHGLAYYPKGVVAVPFTPVPGPRLMAIDAPSRSALLHALTQESERLGLSGLHLLFAQGEEALAADGCGLMRRDGVQFHWHNPGWADFDDYLNALAQPKRKKIRAERRRVAQAGVSVQVIPGEGLRASDWEVFVRCYRSTYAQHHSTPYLNREFFFQLGERMPQHLLMVQAKMQERIVACALLFRYDQRLYGPFWGLLEPINPTPPGAPIFPAN